MTDPEPEPESIDLGVAARESYDASAERYAERSRDNLWNEHYERATLRSLLPPDVGGLRILDAGCAAGHHAAWLVERGADVVAFDISPNMVAQTRGRLGDRVDVRVHDMREPLAFVADASLDVVVSSLAISYVEDLVPVFKEFRRALKPGGTLVLSTHHPVVDWKWFDLTDYYVTGVVEDYWETDETSHHFWRRTVQDLVESLHASGFLVRRYLEPMIDAAVAERFPDDADKIDRDPEFLFIEAVPERVP